MFRAVNYENMILELNSVFLNDPNGYSIPVVVQDGLVATNKEHRVTVVSFSASTNETYMGEVVSIIVVHQNRGDITGNLTTIVEAGATSNTVLQIQDLQPNETGAPMQIWESMSFVPSITSYLIAAQAQIFSQETNITKNFLTNEGVKLKIPGNVSGDGKVDINDLLAWDAPYDSKSGDPNWNSQAGINRRQSSRQARVSTHNTELQELT
jgi:hypothetical protein